MFPLDKKYFTTFLPSLDPINISLDIIFFNLGVALYDSYFLKLIEICFTTQYLLVNVPKYVSVQLRSIFQLGPTLCNPMDWNTTGFPVHHQLPELTRTHVYRVDMPSMDVIHLSQPLSSASPPAFNISQNEGLCKWVISSHQVAKVLEFHL